MDMFREGRQIWLLKKSYQTQSEINKPTTEGKSSKIPQNPNVNYPLNYFDNP
jgi:hypothetical protein